MIRAGTAKTDITPTGTPDLSGFVRRVGPTRGVHDHLYSRAVSLSDGDERTVISSSDLIGFSRGFSAGIAANVTAGSGISAVNLACTHTHSGPATAPLRGCGKPDPDYLAKVKVQIAENAVRSSKRTSPIRISVAKAQADFGFNRRDPGGTVDPELIVLSLLNGDKPVATICNYACHPVVLGHENVSVSGDYAGYFQTRMEEMTGSPCLFLNGACGNVDPRIVGTSDPADARQIGHALADIAHGVSKKLKPIEADRIRTAGISLTLPHRRFRTDTELERRHNEVIGKFGLSPTLFADRVAAWKQRIRQGTYPAEMNTRMSAAALGDSIAVLFIPGELFAEIGLKIKAQSPFPHTLISGYSNGVVGYFPTRAAFEKGGYEPHLANFFYGHPEFDPGIEDIILERAGLLLRKLAAI